MSRQFQVTGEETENTREEKSLVMPDGLARKLVLEECRDWDGRYCRAINSQRYGGSVVCNAFQVIRQSL